MSIKKLGAALVAVLALSAVMAGNAFATPTESAGVWKVAGTTITAPATAECHVRSGTKITLEFTLAGSSLKLTATGVSCVEATIFNEGTFARDSGKLKFSGVTVDEPKGCTTSSTITTKALKTQLWMEGTKTYDKFVPAAGAAESFVNIPIEGCAAEGSYPLKGYVYGLSANATGVESKEQLLTFNEATNTESGSALTFGGNAGKLTAEVVNTLASGSVFGAVE